MCNLIDTNNTHTHKMIRIQQARDSERRTLFVDAYDTVRYRIWWFYWVIVIPPIVAFRDGLLWWDCILGSLEREAH